MAIMLTAAVVAVAPLKAAAFTAPAADIVHITGNLTQVGADSVTVTVSDTSVDVMLTATTKYFLGARAGKREDLQVGDKVDVSALKVDGKWQADRIRFTHPKK
jgi:Cu/Ag efflux protein CusF